jgi:hypothetical protein
MPDLEEVTPSTMSSCGSTTRKVSKAEKRAVRRPTGQVRIRLKFNFQVFIEEAKSRNRLITGNMFYCT